jgi:hypothetical protein
MQTQKNLSHYISMKLPSSLITSFRDFTPLHLSQKIVTESIVSKNRHGIHCLTIVTVSKIGTTPHSHAPRRTPPYLNEFIVLIKCHIASHAAGFEIELITVAKSSEPANHSFRTSSTHNFTISGHYLVANSSSRTELHPTPSYTHTTADTATQAHATQAHATQAHATQAHATQATVTQYLMHPLAFLIVSLHHSSIVLTFAHCRTNHIGNSSYLPDFWLSSSTSSLAASSRRLYASSLLALASLPFAAHLHSSSLESSSAATISGRSRCISPPNTASSALSRHILHALWISFSL